MPPRLKRSEGFTLLELMVVVTIIVVLLALLMPAMDKAVAAAEKTKCLANQRNVAQACRAYAADFSGCLPPGVLNGVATGSDELRDTVGAGIPLSWGLLVVGKYLPDAQLGKIIHCPALDTLPVISSDGYAVQGWGMDRVHTYAVGGSYWREYPTARLSSSYAYRAVSYYNRKLKHLRGDQIGSQFVLSADLLDARFSRYHHPFGYNRVFADVSGAFFEDPDREVEKIALRYAHGYVNGLSYPANDEEIFNYLSVDR